MLNIYSKVFKNFSLVCISNIIHKSCLTRYSISTTFLQYLATLHKKKQKFI